MRVHGWLWASVGTLMLLGGLRELPREMSPATLALLGLGALDLAAGTLVVRRARAGRSLLTLTVAGHLGLATWLCYRAENLAASVATTATTPMTYEEMSGRTAASAMLGMVVWFARGVAAASALFSAWTAIDLHRSRPVANRARIRQ